MIELETERLVLRSWKMEDIDDLVEGLNDLEVSKWLASVPYPYTKDDARAFIERAMNGSRVELAIVLKSENKVIGSTGLLNISEQHGTAGGGIWISTKYHGHGYGREAFAKRAEYAFEVLGLRRLENGYFVGNEASGKMQEAIGYKKEGIRRQKYVSMADGKIHDEVITGLLREEWLENRKD